MRAVSVREVSRSLSRILREVEGGSRVVIPRRGKPIAILDAYPNDCEREQAIERAVALMKEGLPLGGRRFTRDEMHER